MAEESWQSLEQIFAEGSRSTTRLNLFMYETDWHDQNESPVEYIVKRCLNIIDGH